LADRSIRDIRSEGNNESKVNNTVHKNTDIAKGKENNNDDFFFDDYPISSFFNPSSSWPFPKDNDEDYDDIIRDSNTGYVNHSTQMHSISDNEISFSGKQRNYCVCYIDMVNSTKMTSTIDSAEKISRYYEIFLNSMATIVRNFGAKIIKNAGDALIYYFPETSNLSNASAFIDILECNITMISAHAIINAKLYNEQLPPLNYRISADYGRVELAKSLSSQSDDLFGSIMNLCAKINIKAPINGLIIGSNLYQVLSSFNINKYIFNNIGRYPARFTSTTTVHHDDHKKQDSSDYDQAEDSYSLYSVSTKEKRKILNPFKRVSSSSNASSIF
jgi:class 3 adenylate cyclase